MGIRRLSRRANRWLGGNFGVSCRRLFEDPADHLVADFCAQEGLIGAGYGLEHADGMVAVPTSVGAALVLLLAVK